MRGRPHSARALAPLGPAGLERYRLALEAGRMGTWYWDVAHGTLDWDEQLHHVFGLDLGTFDGTFEAYLALLHPDDVAPTVATIQESDGRVERIDAPGSLIGVLRQAEFSETGLLLGPGDSLLLYTDGATEAGGHGDLFGEERLVEVLADAPADSAAGLVASIAAAVEAFTRRVTADATADANRDDLALICVRVD